MGARLEERETELEALADALGDAAGGRGRIVVVEGPGGIGKSRLLSAASDLAPTRMRILSAVGAELERSFAFGVVRQLFEAAAVASALEGAAALAAPLFEPAGFAGDADGDTFFARLHGLSWLLANLADRTPVALLVDDAQWSDDASLRALAFLARRLEDQPVALIVATRPAGDPVIEELLRVPRSRRLAPKALSGAAVDRWVQDALTADADPQFVEAIVTATGGNPFLVAELMHEVREGEVAPRAASARRVAALGPTGVARSILTRLSFLPDPAGELAYGLTILGDGRSLSELAAFAGVPEDAAWQGAAELERAGIVDATSGLRFLHPIIRLAVHDDLPAVRRRVGHARAAVFLRERGARPAEVSAHLLESDPSGDAGAVELLRATASEARIAGDPTSASRLLRRALAEGAGDRPALLFELATAASLAGDGDAEAFLLEAIEVATDAEDRVIVALRLVAFSLMSPGLFAAVDRLEASLASLPAGHPLIGMADGALVVAGQGRVTTRLHVASRNRALPVSDGPPANAHEFAGLITHAYSAGVDDGDPLRGLELARRALAGVPTEMPSALHRFMRNILAVPLLVAESFAEAEAVWDVLFAESRAEGSPSQVAMWAGGRSLTRMRQGNLAGAEADASEALDLMEEVAGAEGVRGVCAAIMILCGIELQRPLEGLLALAATCPPDLDQLPMNQCFPAHGALHLALGSPARALEYYTACDRDVTGWGGDCPSLVPWRSGAAQALAALGRDEEAAALAQREVDLARAQRMPGAHGIALRVLGRVGDPALRRARLEAAVTELERGEQVVELAKALVDLGGELRRAGERIASRPPLDRAYALASAAGASRVADLARSELRSSGIRVAAATAGAGVASLTPAERRVADLAAEGRTNREIAQQLFLSPKTVETHLRGAFRKLDIPSRLQLAECLRAPV